MDLASSTSIISEILSSTGAWLSLAFLLGLIHAFDADHVMALSVFASNEPDARGGVRAGLRWAAGHGLVLLAVGLAFLLIGHGLPESIAILTERVVGIAMILLGALVWIDLARRRSHLHFHEHDGRPAHAHWHTHESQDASPDESPDHRHEHGAMMIGALHGLAGSAPILAVLPAAARSPMLGLGYLLLFAVGVALAMGVVSGLIGHVAGRLSARAQAGGLSFLRAVCASGSIAVGGWLAIAG